MHGRSRNRSGGAPKNSVDHIVAGLERLGAAIRSQAWSDAGAHRLSPLQQNIIQLMAQSSGSLRLSQLAGSLMVSVPTVSEAVGTLVSKGLVSKQRSEGDARALALVLTDSGRAEVRRSASQSNPLQQAVAQLPSAQQEALLSSLITLIEMLQQSGALSVAKTCLSCSFFRANVHPRTDRPHHCAFVDAPLAALNLRVHCDDHQLIPAEDLSFALRKFRAG